MEGGCRPTGRRIFRTFGAECSAAQRIGPSYSASMANAIYRNTNDYRLPPPAAAREIERRVPEHPAAVAGLFSLEDETMKGKFRPRGTLAALAVAMLYVALVLGAPLIVRYGPPPEMASTACTRSAQIAREAWTGARAPAVNDASIIELRVRCRPRWRGRRSPPSTARRGCCARSRRRCSRPRCPHRRKSATGPGGTTGRR